MNYYILRYLAKSNSLFICICACDKPVSIEYYFKNHEMTDDGTKLATITRLVAELEIKYDAYIPPEEWVDVLGAFSISSIDPESVKKEKNKLLEPPS